MIKELKWLGRISSIKKQRFLFENIFSSSNCSHLDWWDISWCMSITENGIRILAESCPKLTVFKAEGCTHVREIESNHI